MLQDWWVHSLIQAGAITLLISWVFWVIFSICLHELAHGYAALWQGDDTPRRLNRMTMNPLVHMGGWSLLAFAIIGIAWGVMPTDPSRYRDGRRGRIYVAGAGPAMNIALAVLTLTAAGIWSRYGTGGQIDLDSDITTFLLTGGWLNLVLALFNLLPIPPLDGSQILSGLSLRMYEYMNNPQVQMFGMFIVLALLLIGGFRALFGAMRLVSLLYTELILLILP